MGVPYRQIDVTVDTEASAMLRAAGYRQAPVVMAGDRVWTGTGRTCCVPWLSGMTRSRMPPPIWRPR